jgi:hypothetical protein
MAIITTAAACGWLDPFDESGAFWHGRFELAHSQQINLVLSTPDPDLGFFLSR